MKMTKKLMGVAALAVVMTPSMGISQQAPAKADEKKAEVAVPAKSQKLTKAQKAELAKKLESKNAEMNDLRKTRQSTEADKKKLQVPQEARLLHSQDGALVAHLSVVSVVFFASAPAIAAAPLSPMLFL